jgi:hypothetical protein
MAKKKEISVPKDAIIIKALLGNIYVYRGSKEDHEEDTIFIRHRYADFVIQQYNVPISEAMQLSNALAYIANK